MFHKRNDIRNNIGNGMRDNLLILQEKGCLDLPDLANCHLPEGRCSCMTLQGLCVTEEYIILTAYCNIKLFRKELEGYGVGYDRKKHFIRTLIQKKMSGGMMRQEKKKKSGGLTLQEQRENEKSYRRVSQEPVHHSCLYVYDKKKRRLLALLELEDINHVGGIAFDGRNLWIAKSTKKALSVIRLVDLRAEVERLVERKRKGYLSARVPAGRIGYWQKNISCDMTASFVTYDRGLLWVGRFVSAGSGGYLQGFSINREEALEGKETYRLKPAFRLAIPARANGASFYHLSRQVFWHNEVAEQLPNTFRRKLFCHENIIGKAGEEDDSEYLFVNRSHGRNRPSWIEVLHLPSTLTKEERGIGKEMSAVRCHRIGSFGPLPPMLEESCISDGILYSVFESSSPAYRDVAGHHCTQPVDEICLTAPEAIVNGVSKRHFLMKRR